MRYRIVIIFILAFYASTVIAEVKTVKTKRTYRNERFGYEVDYYTNSIADDMQIIVQGDGSTVEFPNISIIAYGENADKQLTSAIIKAADSYLEESGDSRSVCSAKNSKGHPVKINTLDAYKIELACTESTLDNTGKVTERGFLNQMPIYLIDLSTKQSRRSVLIIGNFLPNSPGGSEKLGIVKSIRKAWVN